MPLSDDPEKRARQLANLRPAPAAPQGHTRTLVHGGRANVLYRDVSNEVREIMDALAESAPVRDAEGNLPDTDIAAVEIAARALARYRNLSGWLDNHGRIKERTGEVKPAAHLELQAEKALVAALDRLGMNPTSRAKLGLDLQRAAASASEAEANQAARRRLDERIANGADAEGTDG